MEMPITQMIPPSSQGKGAAYLPGQAAVRRGLGEYETTPPWGFISKEG